MHIIEIRTLVSYVKKSNDKWSSFKKDNKKALESRKLLYNKKLLLYLVYISLYLINDKLVVIN